jgi:pilus assembly protein CpaB
MRMKSLILIFIALGCGLVASIGISQVMERGGGTGPVLESEQILVALVDIDAGSKLDVNNIRLEEWPKNKVPEAAIRRVDDAKGKFAVPRFFKGEPIVATRISETANGVAELIPEGYRAIPVKMEEDTVMKAISPGDRVDVSVFLKKDNNEIFKTGVFPIIRNVQIFAVNSNTERTIDAKGGEAAFRTVSLLVKEKQVGELELAKRVGSIQLSLRRRNESDDAIGEETTPMSELLAGKSQMGGEPVVSAPTDSDLSNLLATGPAPGAASEWQMNIQGPNGVEQWSWASRQGLPSKSTALSVGGGSAPTTPSSSTNTNAAPTEQPSETTTEETATDVTTTPTE